MLFSSTSVTICSLLWGVPSAGGRFLDPVASRCGVLKQMVDQWALITGASSGIGAEFARQLATRGMHLILTARRAELMDELAAELNAKHATQCEIIPCDLAAPNAVPSLLQEIERRGLSVHLLVNNAGFGVVGEFDDAPVERLLELVRLNVS